MMNVGARGWWIVIIIPIVVTVVIAIIIAIVITIVIVGRSVRCRIGIRDINRIEIRSRIGGWHIFGAGRKGQQQGGKDD